MARSVCSDIPFPFWTSNSSVPGLFAKPAAALTGKGRAVLWNDNYATEPWVSGGYRPLYLAAPSAPGTPEAPADKHLPGWERGIATVTLTGHQLREALDFINPDGDDDVDQRDDWLTFGIVQHKDDDGNATTGLCCWNDDSDGVLPLDEYPRAAQLDSGQGEVK